MPRLSRRRATFVAAAVVVALLACWSAAIALGSHGARQVSCGGDHRWDVKTLSDAKADQVRFAHPQRHSIRYLLGRTDPHVGTHTARDADGSHVELTVYKLIGVHLYNARIEEDGDVHLVIRDKYLSHKMIVEFPNTLCRGAKDSAQMAEMQQARDTFASLCGLPSWATRVTKASPRPLAGTASLTGVGFFDLKHGTPQDGVAPNNIELHPLLSFSAENCHLGS